MASEDMNIAAELAGLRGEMSTGFAKLEGRLDLIASSQGHTERELNDLDSRVTALEARRVPMGLLASTSGAVSAVVAALAYMVR